jgi:tryptophanyl-tRNA synthetase
LGNYVGAIKPAIEASHSTDVQSCYFLADYHALIKCRDPEVVHRSTLEIAATWLALGLDTDRAIFYRQSDIPEISELTWLLTCVTAKGLMNRAHAYKAAVQENLEKGEDADFAIAMGLFSYPILMAADILMLILHNASITFSAIISLCLRLSLTTTWRYYRARMDARCRRATTTRFRCGCRRKNCANRS